MSYESPRVYGRDYARRWTGQEERDMATPKEEIDMATTPMTQYDGSNRRDTTGRQGLLP